MALETWLIKVKKAISSNKTSKNSNLGVLAFEIAGLMSKLIHLWQSLSDNNIVRLRHESISLEGVRRIVSNEDAFLLALACAEMLENVRVLAKSVSSLSKRCNEDSGLQCFDLSFEDFANTGLDPNGWVLNWKEMESNLKKMDRYVTLTMTLHKEMDEVSDLEHGLKKLTKEKKIIDLQQKLFWHKQEVKYLKENSLWERSFESVTLLLARSVFTILQRIKLVFAVGPVIHGPATVHPSETTTCSGPLLESNSKLLKPPPSTLGDAGLALHYGNLIIVIEKMIRSPHLVGIDAREDLYAMLPSSIRVSLRARLRGVGFSAGDPVLAGEWRDALSKILGWLSPLAHNMIIWQSERSFEKQKLIPKASVVLLFQTLYFANQVKTEAAITELLVGLNYIWRFEREMNAKAFLECYNLKNLQSSG
ncbi:protein PSK SIMULATOR 1-like [Macadamia integrifolia]|uniref:protein PSK SIMULATOR 1-like n=1 Tax=Macadamia integrifolia TaxID=60698 RepID=UPI001C4FAEF2|nr:protein PSK SIMULATOR 1-like [Macadamia integrifolia]